MFLNFLKMPLLSLPSELLLQILDYLEASFFREDLSRLRVCRRWFPIARVVFLSDVVLRTTNLPSVLGSKSISDTIQTEARSLNLHIMSIYDCLAGYRPAPPDPWEKFLFTNEELRAHSRKANDNIFKLVKAISKCWNLQRIRVSEYYGEELQPPALRPPDLFFSTNIACLIKPGHLTSLEVDMCGKESPQFCMDYDAGHLCGAIAPLYTTLKRLILRTRSLCPEALMPSTDGTSLPLEELIVNLALKGTGPGTCDTLWCENLRSSDSLRRELERRACALAKRMKSPRFVRVLRRSEPYSRRLVAFNALAGHDWPPERYEKWDAPAECCDSSDMCEHILRDIRLFPPRLSAKRMHDTTSGKGIRKASHAHDLF